MNAELHQWGSVLLLGALLFGPVSRIIWTLSVRRLQRRRHEALNEAEIAGQLTRARLIALPLALLFAWLFYLNVIGPLYGFA